MNISANTAAMAVTRPVGRHHGIPAGLLGYFYGFGVDFVRVGNDFGDFGIYFS
ncbi:hypothetical protein CK559_002176 [Neisseria gonorrhoeae]